jgi:hypothetical protein
VNIYGGAALFAALAIIPTSLTYDGLPPTRYEGNRTLKLTVVDDLTTVCGQPPKGFAFLGCARGETAFLPNPCPRGPTESYARVLCHELAHLNGWPATHGE